MQQPLLSGRGRRINKQDVGVAGRLMAGHWGFQNWSSWNSILAGTPLKEEITWNYIFVAFKHAKLTEYMSALCSWCFSFFKIYFLTYFSFARAFLCQARGHLNDGIQTYIKNKPTASQLRTQISLLGKARLIADWTVKWNADRPIIPINYIGIASV